MKKIIFILSVMLVVFNIDGAAYVRYVTANLNMRYGPGTGYKIISVIPKGTSVLIDEDCDCKWVPVEYRGCIGYISTKYLSNSAPKKAVKKEKRITSYWSTPYSLPKRSVRHYTNVDGYRVQSPTYYDSAPTGATALCRDGTYSFSRSRRGTCSHHGGVARWL